VPTGDTCPLCKAPLDPTQEWCIRCGAAARTRLAASSNWKAPIIALAVVAALSLAVLAAALVKLAGGSSSTTSITRTIVRAPVTPTSATPTSTTAPGTTTPTTTSPGAVSPGAATGPLSQKPNVTPPPGAAPTKLVIKDLIIGTGAEAKAGDTATVNYVGILFKGGTEFDSSWKRGKPFSFVLGTNQVILGWDQGVAGMKVGGRRELIVPASLAYGAKGFATAVPIPPNAALVFVVDLLGISRSPAGTRPSK